MRVLMTSSSGSGHLGPLLPVATALLARGDEVVIAVPSVAAAAAGRTGAEVVVTPDPPAADLADAWERFRAATPADASRIANGEIFGRLNTVAALPAVRGLVTGRRPDVVVHEAADYAGVVAAVEHGVPHVQVAISFADAEAGSLRHAAVELERFAPGTGGAVEASPYLTRFPQALDPSPYPVTRRYRPSWSPGPAGRVDGRPLVYVTFGTVASSVDDAGALYRGALAAVRGLGVRVLVSTGTGARPELGPVGAEVEVVDWIDQDVVLAEAALVVCHGGSGTVLGALAHGVPVVVVPLFADQPVNGARVAAAGAGLVVERPHGSAAAAMTFDPAATAELRHAVERVLAEPGFRARAGEIGAAMRQSPDVVEVIAAHVG